MVSRATSAAESWAGRTPGDSDSSGRLRGPGFVLFIDDDPLVRRAVERLLARTSIHCEVAAGGREALELLRFEPDRFSVVVADYQMPDIDGISVLREVAAVVPWASRILISGHLGLEDAVAALNSGAISQILTKPAAPHTLLGVIRKAQDRAHLAQHNARLLGQLRQTNRSLTQRNDDLDRLVTDRTRAVLGVLSAALELHVGAAVGRARRLADYARRLGQELGLDEPSLAAVEYGALLHMFADLARPAWPDDGASAPPDGSSSDDGPRVGIDLLRQVDFLQEVAEVVAQQCERYGGPSALRPTVSTGPTTPVIAIGARVFRLVSVLDRLTCDANGRLTRGWAWAREEIRRLSGSELDPTVVAAFERVSDDEWARLRRATGDRRVSPRPA